MLKLPQIISDLVGLFSFWFLMFNFFLLTTAISVSSSYVYLKGLHTEEKLFENWILGCWRESNLQLEAFRINLIL